MIVPSRWSRWSRPWPGMPSAQGVSRLVAGAPRHLDHRTGRVAGREGGASFDGIVIPRWSRCEPRAASLETDCAGAGFGSRWLGKSSAQGVSRLVAGAPRHLDHQVGRAAGAGRVAVRDERQHPSTASRLPRWSRCEPRAASLETDCTGAGFGPRWPGIRSAQGGSRLVADASRHLDHRTGRVAGREERQKVSGVVVLGPWRYRARSTDCQRPLNSGIGSGNQ